MLVIAARTSQGKSAMALQIAMHVSRHEREASKPVLFYSLEMKDEENGLRIMSAKSDISASILSRGMGNKEHAAALDKIYAKAAWHHLLFLSQQDFDVDQCVSSMRVAKAHAWWACLGGD